MNRDVSTRIEALNGLLWTLEHKNDEAQLAGVLPALREFRAELETALAKAEAELADGPLYTEAEAAVLGAIHDAKGNRAAYNAAFEASEFSREEWSAARSELLSRRVLSVFSGGPGVCFASRDAAATYRAHRLGVPVEWLLAYEAETGEAA